MGEKLTDKLERSSKQNSRDLPANTGNTAGTGKTSTGDSNSTDSRTGTGTSGRTGNTTGTGKTEKEKLPELASVEIPTPEKPKKKQTRKPRKKKKEPESFNAEQLSALILAATNIIATRPDMQVWALQPEEANQLATPIANMIAKSEKLQNMGEYADAISLATASIMIFVPRAIAYTEIKKQKKLQNNGGVKLVRTDTKTTKSERNNRNAAGSSTTNLQDDPSSIYAAIQPTL